MRHERRAVVGDESGGLPDAEARGLVADEDALFDFSDARTPDNIGTGRHFDAWWKKKRHHEPDFLDFDPAKLIDDIGADSSEAAFPDKWRQGSINYDLQYKFEPGDPLDGVTVLIPVPLLAGLEDTDFDWLVPGVREELVTELIRSLPKALRKTLVPAPEFAARAMDKLVPFESPMAEQLAEILRSFGGHGINASDFQPDALPEHLKMTFASVDRRGTITDHDKSLAELKKRRAGQITSSVAKATKKAETDSVTEWTADTLGAVPETVTTKIEGNHVDAFPALEATKDGVRVKVFPTKAAADASMVTATLALSLIHI